MDNLKIKNILCENDIKDYDALEAYIELMLTYKNTHIESDIYCENHHICPKSIYPEYRLSKWNIVKLPFDIHVEAHRLLCLIYQTGEMKRAYSFISRYDYDDKVKQLTKGAFVGDDNPSKRQDVRDKISQSKKGKRRKDMDGKKFFGADENVYLNGIAKMKEKLSDTVVVRDKDGNKFRVSVNDEKYLSGEYVPFNLGVKKNSASKRPEVMNQIMESRNAKYNKFAEFTFDEMVDHLLDYHYKGKNIFKDGKLFASNFVMMINKTKFQREDLYNAVVQRLSKV